MTFSFLDLLTIIGSLGFFIYGMKVMSEGLQKAAGEKLRFILGSMTKNRYLGVLSGFLITALVQSSSATTVMTVSFVNAGLLSLVQSAGIMMGANIGTTITAWLVSTFGFKVKIAAMALPIIAFAFPLMFMNYKKSKYWGEFLIGFALLFMGLGFLKAAVPDIKSNPELLVFLQSFTHWGYGSYLLFIGIGTLLTIVVQSSSASMTITLVLVAKGWITFDIAAAMVLGENIGTTITAELASVIGNVYAKRSARIHSLFNIIGVTWMLIVFLPFIQFVSWVTMLMGFDAPTTIYTANELASMNPNALENREESVTYGLSVFHTLFNLTNVIVLIGFAGNLVKIATRTVKSKSEEDEEFHLEYINTAAIKTPELALMEVKSEIVVFSAVTQKMVEFIGNMYVETKKSRIEKILKKIKKREEYTDRLEIEIADYLSKVTEIELNASESLRVRSMLSIVHDLERLGDILFQVGIELDKKADQGNWFTPEQREGLIGLTLKVGEAITIMQNNLDADWEKVDISLASEKENEINTYKKALRKKHLTSIENRDYNIKSGLIYSNLYTLLERAGDHVINVNEALKGQV
jgi:phosphate:Na+ symporter